MDFYFLNEVFAFQLQLAFYLESNMWWAGLVITCYSCNSGGCICSRAKMVKENLTFRFSPWYGYVLVLLGMGQYHVRQYTHNKLVIYYRDYLTDTCVPSRHISLR